MVEVPSPEGPYGARGVGEPPIVAVAAAIGNAIADATGANLTALPMIPEGVLAALRKRQLGYDTPLDDGAIRRLDT